MDELVAHLGPLTLKLSAVEHRVVPRIDGSGFMRLGDGTEVSVAGGAEPYLFIDHRRNTDGPCRVEYWECATSPEGNIRGLVIMADAAGQVSVSSPGERFPDLHQR